MEDWPGLIVNDPSTGVPFTAAHKPGPSFDSAFINLRMYEGAVIDPTEFETRVAAGAAVGTAMSPFMSFDQTGRPLTAAIWSLPSGGVNDGSFSIDAATGVPRVANAALPNGLRWMRAVVTGNNVDGISHTYERYRFVIVGTGHVPGLAY